MTRFARTCLALSIAVFAPAALAAGLALPSTGVGAGGAALPGGSADPQWQVVAGPGITTPQAARVVTDQHPFGQYFEVANARWIWAAADGSSVVGATYRLDLAFDLTGYDAATATLSGLWGVDNNGRIVLNGADTGFSLGGGDLNNFNVQHAFTLSGGFVSGVNHLSFDVVDLGNPAALNVSGLVVSAAPVPEPAVWALWAGGLAALATRRRLDAARAAAAPAR